MAEINYINGYEIADAQAREDIDNIEETYATVAKLNTETTSRQNADNNLQSQINGLASGSPLVASSISDMTDTTRSYVLVTDGHWYWYDGEDWQDGGAYQATEIDEKSVYKKMLEQKLQNNFKESMELVNNIIWNAGGFYNASGIIVSDTNYKYTSKINVNPNEVYFFPNATGPNNSVCFFDGSDNFVSKILVANAWEPFIIPDNVSKMALTSTARTDRPYTFTDLYKCNNYYINGQGKIMYGDMDLPFQNSFIPTYEDITTELTPIQGYFTYVVPNRITDYYSESSPFSSYQLNVIPGEKYKITSDFLGQVVLYQLIGNGENISYPSSSTASRTTETKEITIPKGYYLLNVSGYNNSIKIEKINGYTFTSIVNTNNYDIEQLQRFNINEQLKNDFKWSSSISSGKYATFTFDDLRTDIDQIEDLFESKHVPCCFAAIPSRLNVTTSTTHETMKEVLDRAVENGGEVLAHWGSPLTSSSTDSDYINVYVGAKQALEEAGYEVNGIITAGGTNYQTQDFTKDVLLARNNYFYADLTATNNINIEQYLNRRNFLDSGAAAIKTLIDSYISGTGTQPHSKWLNFASHGTANTSLSDIEEIIDYCIANNIQIVTWKYLYDHFKSSQLEERIKQLEN